MSLFVKLCGIKTESDLEAAVDAGADAVGFVLTPSPRQISLSQAGHLNGLLPDHVLGVAVFHEPSPELLRRTEEEVRPALFQSETATLVGLTPDRILPVVADGEDLGRRIDDAAAVTSREWVLVDSSARGGTGRPVSRARLAQVATSANMILAGGLDQENVAEIVSRLRPFGVDVSSGIERSPGVKDPERMRSFVAAARAFLPLAGGPK
ncbi:MAG TPA: phosphoribosylanthranilate isomerase [Acidimicrobiia bacterium]|nr:phosphoribosylanthranilate isomerase [Acidimicrobiia bacterium]